MFTIFENVFDVVIMLKRCLKISTCGVRIPHIFHFCCQMILLLNFNFDCLSININQDLYILTGMASET